MEVCKLSSYKRILVCVTQQKTCERLIKKASQIAVIDKSDLFVIHVAKDSWNFLDNKKEGEALEYLFAISKSVGANLSVLKSDDIVKTITQYVNDNKIDCVIMGESPGDHKENNFYNELKFSLNNIELKVIPQD